MSRLFSDTDFAPGKVRWNELLLDADIAIEEQLDNLHDDAVWVEYSDICSLHIHWRPDFNPGGRFYVIISKNRDDEEFNPVCEKSCKTIAELQLLVPEMVKIAQDTRMD